MKLGETTKTVLYIVLGIGALVGMVLGVDAYFAKSSAVDKIAESMDIGVSDGMIFQQQQQVRYWEAKAKFEERKQPPTPTEQEVIRQEKERLGELEKQRTEKIQGYERRK